MSAARRLGAAARALGAALMTACASAVAQSGAGPASAVAAPQAAIAPGDVVRVRIWREPDLSGEFAVDETGTVVLPRLGALDLSGATPMAVRSRVTDAFEQILSHTSVEVTVLRRLQVLGAVRNPGLYTVDPTMTVEDGIALAGGVTLEGNPKHIELLRNGVRLPVRLDQRTPINQSTIRSGDQLYVKERSWVSRNAGVVVGLLSVVTTATVLVLRHY
jgi:polysaccharide export outer membrane protein